MDNHPIPQDITGFKFKLIGQMTIRQFIYLAIGAIIAWIIFFVIEPPTLIKWPLAGISLGIGAIVAFVPIDGRPMDTMMKNFFSALTSPTKFIYQKESVQTTEPGVQAHYATTKTPPAQQPMANQPAQQQVAPVSAPTTAPAPPSPKAPAAPPPVLFPDEKEQEKKEPEPQPVQNTGGTGPAILPDEKEEMKKQIEELQKKLAEKESKIKQSPQPQAPIQQSVNDQASSSSADELAEAQRQKEALEKQIMDMQAKQEAENTKKFTPITAKPLEQTQNVRRVPADMASAAGIGDIPDAPNLITGIVKDPRGNPIQNILIEVLDTDGNPVRAFKTNKLGKFASATSLSNGNYVVKFEDSGEKHKFDTVQIELIGEPVMPLEIISVDPREELRRELFN